MPSRTRFTDVKCYAPKAPTRDDYYRPLLLSVELTRPKRHNCCHRPSVTMPRLPCEDCDGIPAKSIAYTNNLSCSGNRACGACGCGGSTSCLPRHPGQGPCDPHVFSRQVFPRYAPFYGESKCAPPPLVCPTCADGCSLAPVGGTSMYGAFTRSCFSCNSCGGGKLNVCNVPCCGCNNAPCSGGCGSSTSGCCG